MTEHEEIQFFYVSPLFSSIILIEHKYLIILIKEKLMKGLHLIVMLDHK